MPLCRMIDGGQRTRTLFAPLFGWIFEPLVGCEDCPHEGLWLSRTQIAQRRRKTGPNPAGHRLALKRNEATMRKRQEDEDHQAQRHRGYL